MGTRGPKSKAELSVIPGNITEIVPRPPAPRDLTDEQADEWSAIVARMPADWFQRETHQMLKAFCRHASAAGRVAQLINAHDEAESVDVEEYDRMVANEDFDFKFDIGTTRITLVGGRWEGTPPAMAEEDLISESLTAMFESATYATIP